MKYYNDESLGVVGVEPGPTSGEVTYLTVADSLERIQVLADERDALRSQVTRWSTELADAIGCANEHGVAPPFGEMVEKVRRMRTELDELYGERDAIRNAPTQPPAGPDNRVCTPGRNRQWIVDEVARRWPSLARSSHTRIDDLVNFVLDASEAGASRGRTARRGLRCRATCQGTRAEAGG